ncbi:nucleotidyltransferase domain-containing protein [Streptomyces sp. MI02-7b]|uniref:nucleotidyltransferase domain-containing protein n=1 Tax=Streptomyces sp. MI02-7b TaxID=462941 RepID=UPI0029B80F4E|nr:nucleotidyltransferase domain-containing protein [Streptomyces sp. MI02-7b]MDX3075930.1 nucleotidyltransferase domain-containing protein [Streptomyces sp. MI02-7b]
MVAEKMDAARRLGRALAEDSNGAVDSVYLAGSLTAGLGNPTSDADLFVLVNPGAETDADDVTQYNVDGHRVDVERYSLANVEEQVERIITFELRRDGLTELHKLAEPLDFVLRLRTSETVVDSAVLSRLKKRVAGSLAAVQRTAINHAAIGVNGHLEDFLGAAAEGDLDTAAFAGQELVAYAGKAVAGASGDLYFSNKWVYKQLARTAVEGFPMEAFTAYQRGLWTEGGTDEAESLVRFVQTCVCVSQLLGAAGVPLGAWPSWTPDASPTQGLWRNPSYNVLTTTDGVLLHWELHRQLLLKEPAAYVWALCDGRTEKDIVVSVEHLATQVPSLAALDSARIASILASLRHKSLVATEPYHVLGMV